jgi:hypothetical protein
MEIEEHRTRAERGIRASRQRGHELAALAGAQHGVVARRHLLDIGFSFDQIHRMRGSGRLHDVHNGVYAVGHRVLSARGWWMAAVLAGGPDARVGHRSCAALSNLRRTSLSYVEVTAPTHHRRLDGVRIYVNRRLAPQDRETIDGIPCVSVALTLLQLAAVLPRRELERACDEAEVQQVFDLAAIEELLDRSRGCRGAARLRAVLADHAIGTTLTRPGLEARTLALLDAFALPRPQVNVRVVCRPGVAPEVDFLWRTQRLVLETDGIRFHRTSRQIERDRRKEAALVRAGYRVLRATSRQVEREPRDVALMVAAALAVTNLSRLH